MAVDTPCYACAEKAAQDALPEFRRAVADDFLRRGKFNDKTVLQARVMIDAEIAKRWEEFAEKVATEIRRVGNFNPKCGQCEGTGIVSSRRSAAYDETTRWYGVVVACDPNNAACLQYGDVVYHPSETGLSTGNHLKGLPISIRNPWGVFPKLGHDELPAFYTDGAPQCIRWEINQPCTLLVTHQTLCPFPIGNYLEHGSFTSQPIKNERVV